jgi:benzoylformate decarboxylase
LGDLLNAHVSGTPLVVTAGQQDSGHTLTDPLLYGDLVSLATPAVKWAQEVTHPDQISILVRRISRLSSSADRTGVRFAHHGCQEETTAVDIDEVSTIDRAAVALDRLADYLAAIPPGKLAIIAGDEISTSNAAAETVLLADALGAPVYGSSWPNAITSVAIASSTSSALAIVATRVCFASMVALSFPPRNATRLIENHWLSCRFSA